MVLRGAELLKYVRWEIDPALVKYSPDPVTVINSPIESEWFNVPRGNTGKKEKGRMPKNGSKGTRANNARRVAACDRSCEMETENATPSGTLLNAREQRGTMNPALGTRCVLTKRSLGTVFRYPVPFSPVACRHFERCCNCIIVEELRTIFCTPRRVADFGGLGMDRLRGWSLSLGM